tara:strand:- start:47 stop:889 length:843 start_codon:yes stop_codon:yes gene_type:complete
MKNTFFNISVSIVTFLISYLLAHFTKSPVVKTAVIIAFIIQWVLFLPAYFFQTEKFYDIVGSFTYLTVVLYTFFSSYISSGFNIGNFIISFLIIIWALRLGFFLFLRICKEGEDKRFKFIKPSATRFFMTWTLQGMWVSVCSLSALTAMTSPTGLVVNGMLFIGISIFIFGLLLEIIADYQKTQFRNKPENKGHFISSGLWAYSRHPNYVGEIVLWTGVSIMSFSSLTGVQYIALISPIFTYLLLVYVSGVRILEASGKKRWGHLQSYQEYLKNTPSLLL